MRPLHHGDIVALARALLPAPAIRRAALAAQILGEAEAADRYRKAFRRHHPEWGNGSLMAAANAHNQRPEPPLSDPDYCQVMILAFEALLGWRGQNDLIHARSSGTKAVMGQS